MTRLACAAAVTIVLAAPTSAFGNPDRVEILVSPSGSGPYLAWATFQNYAGDYTDEFSFVAVETPGFVYNVRFVAESPELWTNTVFGSGQVAEWAAAEGLAPFFPSALPAASDFRVLGVMSQTSNFFVTLDSAIASPDNFSGKRVGTGLMTQNEWGMHHRILLDHWGLTPRLASFNALGANENIDAMLDGRSDVGALVVHSAKDFRANLEPQPFRALESSGRSWHYVNVPEEKITDFIEETGAPFLLRRIPEGTFTNQPEELTTFGNFMTLSAHKDFPEDRAYELVRIWMEIGEQIGEYSAIARIWDPESISELARVSPEMIHPGAMRAFREAGLVE
nr:TAXI family TRAP transporter solute-binding subunit [Natronocella acetinitrilica]